MNFIYKFTIARFIVYLFIQYLLDTYPVAGTVLGSGFILYRLVIKYLAKKMTFK